MINYFEILNVPMEDLLESRILASRDVLDLKANFCGYFKQIFMVLHGLFSRDYSGLKEEKKLFEEAFPYLSKLAKETIGNDYIPVLIAFLNKTRDKFTHGISKLNFDDACIIKLVSKIKNYNSEIQYVKSDKITYAGFFAFLCCLSNDKMITYFLKSSRVNQNAHFKIKLVNKDFLVIEDYASGIAENVGMCDEILIRKPSGSAEVVNATFGKFMDAIALDKNNNFSYESGNRDDVCDFSISGSYKKNIFTVNKNSIFLDYFENDYKLQINDEEKFVKLSEQVPPFYLIAHLKKMGVKVFDSNTLSDKDIEFILKYNKPKYYVDKNINTIFYPKNQADVRAVGQITSSTLLYIFINFEESVYRYFKLNLNNGYSKFLNALKYIKISNELAMSLVAIRNFIAHQYIIGDYICAFDKFYKINMKFIIEKLSEFLAELKIKDEHLHNLVAGDIAHRLVTQLLYFKYADIIKASTDFLRHTFDLTKVKNLQLKEVRQGSSIITTEIENILCSFIGDQSIFFNKLCVKYLVKTAVIFKGNSINFYTIGKPDLSRCFPNITFKLIKEKRDGFLLTREFE